MEIVSVIVLVSIILIISYVFFDQKEGKKKKKREARNAIIGNFYKKEMERISDLPLAGIGNDKNSDYEVDQVVKKIKMTADTRVKLYD